MVERVINVRQLRPSIRRSLGIRSDGTISSGGGGGSSTPARNFSTIREKREFLQSQGFDPDAQSAGGFREGSRELSIATSGSPEQIQQLQQELQQKETQRIQEEQQAAKQKAEAQLASQRQEDLARQQKEAEQLVSRQDILSSQLGTPLSRTTPFLTTLAGGATPSKPRRQIATGILSVQGAEQPVDRTAQQQGLFSIFQSRLSQAQTRVPKQSPLQRVTQTAVPLSVVQLQKQKISKSEARESEFRSLIESTQGSGFRARATRTLGRVAVAREKGVQAAEGFGLGITTEVRERPGLLVGTAAVGAVTGGASSLLVRAAPRLAPIVSATGKVATGLFGAQAATRAASAETTSQAGSIIGQSTLQFGAFGAGAVGGARAVQASPRVISRVVTTPAKRLPLDVSITRSQLTTRTTPEGQQFQLTEFTGRLRRGKAEATFVGKATAEGSPVSGRIFTERQRFGLEITPTGKRPRITRVRGTGDLVGISDRGSTVTRGISTAEIISGRRTRTIKAEERGIEEQVAIIDGLPVTRSATLTKVAGRPEAITVGTTRQIAEFPSEFGGTISKFQSRQTSLGGQTLREFSKGLTFRPVTPVRTSQIPTTTQPKSEPKVSRPFENINQQSAGNQIQQTVTRTAAPTRTGQRLQQSVTNIAKQVGRDILPQAKATRRVVRTVTRPRQVPTSLAGISTTLAPRQAQRSRAAQQTSTIQKAIQRSATTTKLKETQTPLTRQISRSTTTQIPSQRQFQSPTPSLRTPFIPLVPITPSTTLPPTRVGGGLPFGGLGGFGRGARRSRPQPTKFTPTVFAAALSIRGRETAGQTATGLSLRPIIVTRTKKKKAPKKKVPKKKSKR